MNMRRNWTLTVFAASLLWGCPNQGEAPKTGGSTASPSPGTAVSATNTSASIKGPSIVHPPNDLPPSIGKRPPQHVRVDLEAVELEGQLADGTTYTYMTFSKQVPGPFLRVRVDDTVELHLKNLSASQLTHSIDLHAVTGPGGGSVLTQAPPGQEKVVTFKAIKPGLFVYHCATAMVAEHITNGMYGMILVEPPEGLPPVDREFYVMQGELYTERPFGEYGLQKLNRSKLLTETPDYLVFNGAVGALTKEYPLQAKVGETIRMFFGVGGPNMISSFHIIGEHFDRLYNLASLTSPPLTTVQTTLVPPGGAAIVELKLEVPGKYLLVDHALSRLEKGLLGFLQVEGPEHPELYREVEAHASKTR
jgi:nitrite reductase (NO-forming)